MDGVAGEHWNSVTCETHAGRGVDGCCAQPAEAEGNGNGSETETEKGKKED